ncbi:hypothetical protein BH24ACT22_BH24ACT22_09010 [soil metagenome]
MKHSGSRSAEADTRELPGVGGKRRVSRRKRRKFSGPLRFLLTFEGLALVLALVSLMILVPLRGLLSPVPVLLFLAALVLFLIPGFLFSSVILNTDFPGAARLPAAFALSTGLFGLVAVPFLALQRSFTEYLLACGVILALALGFAVYRLVLGESSGPAVIDSPSRTLSDLLWVPFLGLAGVLAYAAAVMQEEPNGDSWIYLSYVRDYTNSDNLTLYNPILGGQAADSYLSFRTSINGWLMEQSLLSRVSGIPPVNLVLDYLAPTLVVTSLLAAYALARILLGEGPALLAGSLMALFFLVDLQSTIPTAFLSPGNDFVARVTEDKYVTRFLFLPVALGVAVLYLRERKLRYLGVFGFLCWSVAIVHPIGLILLGISVAGLGFFHLVSNFRNRSSWKAVLGLGAAVSSIAVPPLLYLIVTGSPLLSRLSDSGMTQSLIETWSSSNRLLVVGDDSYMMHPSFLLNPAIIAAYALGVSFVIFRLRRSFAAQLLLGVLMFTPLLIYVPPISTPLAKIIGPWVLVRLSWPLSLASPIVIGWVIWEVLDYLGDRLEGTGINVFRYATPLLPVLLMVVLIAATSPTSIASVRSADESGEIPQDQASCSDPVFLWMQKGITEQATVLAPYAENSCIPAQSSNANVVTLRGLSRNNRVEENMFRFYSTFAVDGEDQKFLRREEIDYVLLSSSSPLNAQVQHLPGFTALDSPGDRYRLYNVDRNALAETPAVTANTLMTNDEFDAAAGLYNTAQGGETNEQFLAYMGFGLWNSKQGLYADAATNYEQALEIDREQPALYPLLSTAYNSAGEPDLARLALENGVDRFPNSVELRTNLSALLMSQDPAAAVTVQREVVKMFPEVPEYRVKLGTYLALKGDDAAADRQFEYAIRKNPLSAQLHADAGSANQTADRKEAAIRHYERALQLSPDLEEARNQLETLRD